MYNYKKHLISENAQIEEALLILNKLATDAILFVVNNEQQLVGSLTDGDVRRGLLKKLNINDIVKLFIQEHPKCIRKDNYNIEDIIELRENNFKVIPIVDKNKKIINILNFRIQKSYLPVDAVIMAGGIGRRLKPLTDTVPKPLLKVADKTIIDHNIDRLQKFGVDDYWLSVRYLGEQLEAHLGDGASRNINMKYVWEDEPLGTIGAVSKIDDFKHDYVLVTNSDILTNLDYENFFLDFIEKDADMSVVTIPYVVGIPYAVMQTNNNHVISFKEKPKYTYYSNGGIYLIKRAILNRIPKDVFYNSTDLMEALIESGNKLISYPIHQYWLDIGKHEDFEQAQKDIKQIKF
jgi:dTDP-glucose pyrophosphorylase